MSAQKNKYKRLAHHTSGVGAPLNGQAFIHTHKFIEENLYEFERADMLVYIVHNLFLLVKFKREVIILEYVIKNHKNVYIRLNGDGRPVTCTKQDRTLFEYSKAMNVCENLPKTLKKLNFKVDAIPDIVISENFELQENVKQKVIQKENYILPENVTRWIEKFGICGDILSEAKQRKSEILTELSNLDKEFVNIIHEIELEKSKDLYGGWKEYIDVRTNREKRRNIKDELLIINNVLRTDFRCLSNESVEKAIAGLSTRKFTYRVIEEDEVDNHI